MKTPRNTTLAALAAMGALATLTLAGCGGLHAGHSMGGMGNMGHMGNMGEGAMKHEMRGAMAHVKLQATQGNTAAGMVMFHAIDNGVMMHASVSGLKPGQMHGFHLHEKGDCSAADGTSAGGHFNPTAQPHGPQEAAHHAGDLPALKADANGRAEAMVALHGVTLGDGGVADIAGRGLIVHAGPDDYATQPTGNSGARIACGVVHLMAPKANAAVPATAPATMPAQHVH